MAIKTLHQISEEYGVKYDSLYRVVKRNPNRFGASRSEWVADENSEGLHKWMRRYLKRQISEEPKTDSEKP